MAGLSLNFLRSGKETSLKLYDSIENLPVELFYRILKENNPNLLLKEENQKLSEKQIRRISEVWGSITDDYYKCSNLSKYKSEVSRLNRIGSLQNEITTCSAACQIFALGDREFAISVLSEFKHKVITDEDVKKVIRKLVRLKTNLRILKAKQKKEDVTKKKYISDSQNEFWDLVQSIENSLGRQLDVEKITVSRWVSMIKGIKQRNKPTKKGRNRGRRN